VERRLFAHRYATAEIETYGECIDPPKVTADRAEVLAVLMEEDHELLSKPEVDGALKRLATHSSELEPLVAKQVEVLVRDRQRIVGVPAALQAKLVRLQAESYDAWLAAKANDDWRSFAPYLDRLVNLQRKIAIGMDPDADPYDTMLDMYEKGTNRTFYNTFFSRVKQCVVPLLSSISMSGRTLSRSCVEGHFDEARQWELAQDVARLEGIDEGAHYLTSTEYPFSESMTSHYVVTAGHVVDDDLMSNVYTILHEVGHNLYEQGVDPAFNRTSLKGGTSMGMHEAQSRFFENYVGRDRAFMGPLLDLMRRRFPGQLGRVTPNQLWRAVNRVVPGNIRTEADELTYPMHIICRYEIEQMLLAGTATAREVPKLWAERYQKYIGAVVTTDTEGALQDVHWSQGAFGYFPTYALGGAFAAQLRAKMIEEGMDWEGLLAAGDLAPIRAWLGERIWRHGRTKDSQELIKDACGEPFNVSYYADYLHTKFSALYGLR
jgi:carboxypeptidase Taq